MKVLLVWFVACISAPLASSQRSSAPEERLPAVHIIIELPDDSRRAFDLRSDEIARVATDAAVAEGWDLDPGSNYFVRVCVEPLAQRQEDLYAFRISVEGGSIPRVDSTGTAFHLTSVHVVDVPFRDRPMLLAETDEMVRSIAYKLLHRIHREDYRLVRQPKRSIK